MPLTAKLSKPRLCNDNGFLNLWIQDRPFSLDSVQHLPKFVLSNFFQTVCDDKSGYDHIQLTFDSRTFFDLEWGGWLFVSCCIPFGWKSFSYIDTPPALLPRTIYVPLASLHPYTLTTDIAVSSLSRTTAFQLLIKIFPQMKALIWLWPKRQFLSNALLFPSLVISLVWRNLPCKQVLGFISDSENQAFILLPRKRDFFFILFKRALQSETPDRVTLQNLGGKCISMALAVPGARLYTNEIECLFETTISLNIDLHVHFVPGPDNPADAPSRCLNLQDSKLSPALWSLVQSLYGGSRGHSIDLMARSFNVQTDLAGYPLPFFF